MKKQLSRFIIFLVVLTLPLQFILSKTSTSDSNQNLTPIFIAADRALGENANDEPMRACMTRVTKILIEENKAYSEEGIDYSILLDLMNSDVDRDTLFDNGF
jgi:hypothetical protein